MDSRKDVALHELARQQHERRQQDPQPASTRRNLLRTAIGGGAAALLFGSATGSASAQSGTLPVASDPPLLKIRADRMVLAPRTSDVSGASDSTIWYRSDE